jgi:hypothetical protein
MKETYINLPGYEGLYQVSNLGNVKSCKRKGSSGCVIRPAIRRDGYLQVHLQKDGKGKSLLVHRLVALAFLPLVDGKHQVNHKDGNRSNNASSNLEWCTAQENTLHAHDVLKKNTRQVLCVETGVVYPSIRSAARSIGYDNATIQRICAGKGRSKTAKGFHWVYV